MKIYANNGNANIIGPNVHKARIKLDLTQDQLAAKLQVSGVGLTQKAISRIEKQERFVADFELVALADILHVDVIWLLTDDKK